MAGERSISRRLLHALETFRDRPYVCCPLGPRSEHERLVVDLGAFDCVTLVESALALARSRSTREFLVELKHTRYRQGRVDWSARLHYFSDWLRHNQRRGALWIRTRGAGSRPIEASLSVVEGLASRRVRFHIVPKRNLRSALPRISNGTIVGFASVRARLDFFHTGVLFYRAGGKRGVEDLVLYQAKRSAGRVVVEPLVDFLAANRMRGLAFATPLGPGEKR